MIGWRIALAGLALGVSAAALAVPEGAPDPEFTGRDLFNLSVASDPQISPDGRQVAYVRLTADVMTDRMRPSIWLIDVESGRQRPIVAGPGNHTSPRWSPDGRRLAFVSSAEGPAAQLFVRWMDSGDNVRLTGLPDSPGNIAWSPDGNRIAYSMTVPGEGLKLGKAPPKPEGATWAAPLEIFDTVTYRNDGTGYVKPGFSQLFLIDANGSASRQLTSGPFHHGGPIEWTPDGRALLFSANRKDDWQLAGPESEIYELSLDGGAVRALTTRVGPDTSPTISPDGRMIAYLGSDNRRKGFEQSRVYVMDRSGRSVRRIAPALDRSIGRIEWARDGRALIAGYEEEGGYKLARIGLDGRVSELASGLQQSSLDRPYVSAAWSVAEDGTPAFTAGSADRPADVAIARRGAVRRLTQLNDLFLAGEHLAKVRPLDARTADGTRIPGWLATPPGYVEGTRIPLILEIHGGPYQSYGPAFATDVQLYTAAGYAVLYANPRGSTGYGEAFIDGIEKAFPRNNHEDLMASVDAAIASGVADPGNLFITGGSGGGAVTAWMIGKTNRFRAAAAQKPVINWTTQALVADATPFFGPYWVGGLPWENPMRYWEQSPLSLVGNVKTPTLVVVGTDDHRTPPAEAEQLYAALKLQGVPTALVRVPGAPHNLVARPSQSAAKAAAIIAWFDRYKSKAGTAASK